MERHAMLALVTLAVLSAGCTSDGWRPTLYPYLSEYESCAEPAEVHYACPQHGTVLTSKPSECPRRGAPLVVVK